jgi:transketolase
VRNTFVETLLDLASKDNNIILVTGDLGFGVLNKFWEAYPDRFINAGISEQNMTSMAVGMALEGKNVFIYSIGNFPSLRCLEQIRNDAAYHDANVKIVSVGGGFAYGQAGMSHHATEDIAILRALPGVLVFAPGDPQETVLVTQAAYKNKGTCYIRLGKGGEKNVYNKINNFEIGRAIKIFDGSKVALFSTGAILSEANTAALNLNRIGISTALYSFPTVKPIDKQTIEKYAKQTKLIITIEEHNINGGFGSAVAEVLAEIEGKKALLKRIAINDLYSDVVGNQEYLREYYGITSGKIEMAVKLSFQNNKTLF